MSVEDFFIGALVGLVLILTGAGGAIVASPLLVFFSGVSINDATGLSLAVVWISSACMTIYASWRRHFAFRPVMLLAVGGMLAAPFGRIAADNLDSRIMGVVFALTAMSFSIYCLFGSRIAAQWRKRRGARPPQPVAVPGRVALAGWGSLAGALSGFFGIGGAIVLMPIALGVLRVPASVAIYHCLPVMFLITSTGALTFISYADSDTLGHLVALVAGSLAGSALGLSLMSRMNPRANLRVLGAIVMVFAFATLYHSLRG